MESKEKRIDHLKNIDTETPEGRLLTAALGKLVRFMPGKTYDDILLKLNEISDKIFYNGNYTANDNRQRSPRPFLQHFHKYKDVTPIQPFPWRGMLGWQKVTDEDKAKIKIL